MRKLKPSNRLEMLVEITMPPASSISSTTLWTGPRGSIQISAKAFSNPLWRQTALVQIDLRNRLRGLRFI